MTTLHISHAEVKPAAFVVLFNSATIKQPRPFGKGVLASLRTHRVEYTAADAMWWAEESARISAARELAELNAEVEAMAEDARQFDAYMTSLDFTNPDAHSASGYEECELASMFGRNLAEMIAATA